MSPQTDACSHVILLQEIIRMITVIVNVIVYLFSALYTASSNLICYHLMDHLML